MLLLNVSLDIDLLPGGFIGVLGDIVLRLVGKALIVIVECRKLLWCGWGSGVAGVHMLYMLRSVEVKHLCQGPYHTIGHRNQWRGIYNGLQFPTGGPFVVSNAQSNSIDVG